MYQNNNLSYKTKKQIKTNKTDQKCYLLEINEQKLTKVTFRTEKSLKNVFFYKLLIK